MILNLSDISSEPLHNQISRQIRAKILAGGLQRDASLPSIRAFAKQHRVSVITVKHAYQDLENEGLIHSRRRQGFFVSSIESMQKSQISQDRLTQAMKPILKQALREGLNQETIENMVHDIMKELGVTSIDQH